MSFVQCVQVLVLISICLFHQQLYNLNKEEHKILSGEESLLMCGGSVYCNSLGSPVNLWTTGTGGWQFVLWIHCVMFISVVSPLFLSLWAEMSSSSDECASESGCVISSVISRSVRFLLVAILLSALRRSLAYTKRNTFCLFMIWASALPGLSHVIAQHGTDPSVELKTDISINLHFRRVRRNPCRRKDICLGPTLHEM